jgi:hypothetical protein
VCEGGGNAVPTDAKVLGFSVDDVLAELRGSGPRRATWSDGSERELAIELSAEAPEPCQQVGDSLSFRATLHARGEDGFDVRSVVHVDALDAGGRVGAIRIESAELGPPSPDAGVLADVEWVHDGVLDSGSLSLRGADASARW